MVSVSDMVCLLQAVHNDTNITYLTTNKNNYNELAPF